MVDYLTDQTSGIEPPFFNVVVSVREEFLRSIYYQDGVEELDRDLRSLFKERNVPSVSVYLVSMGKLPLRLVREYLKKRIGDELFRTMDLKDTDPLATMLQRPLLLSLFSKALKASLHAGSPVAISKLDQPMKLLRWFIEDHQVGRLEIGHNDPVEYKWDIDKTATMILKHHLAEGGFGQVFPCYLHLRLRPQKRRHRA